LGTQTPSSPSPAPSDTDDKIDPNAQVPKVDAPPQSTPECLAEQEPNDKNTEPTAFTKCVTGELSSKTDVDYLTIKAPDGVTDMLIDHTEPDGTIQYTVTIANSGSAASGSGGTSTNNFNMSFTDKAPQTKVKAGATYLFALKWDNMSQGGTATKRPYSLRVNFQ